MIATMVKCLTDGATIEEIKENGLGDYYTEHGISLYPVNASG
ncbi:MAG: manganese catalase family protein, partial [Clostridia bacterium]|nr:manganese catalase family protein [Clostridia bacterium]